MEMSGCKLCQIAEMNDHDFYKKWCLKRLSKFDLIHAPNCPNRTQKTLYNLGIRQTKISKQFE
jgi:hypothetical protein